MAATTYVLGAGASRHVGYPLASGTGSGLLDFMLGYPMQPYPNAARFLIDAFGKSPNIEDLITELQSRIDSLTDSQTPKDKAERMKLGNLRGNLGASLREWFREIHNNPAYAEFAAKLVQPGDVVVTFNYDDSLERELRRAGKWDISRGYGFSLGTIENSSDVLLLKLHGSTNWLISISNGAMGGSQLVSEGPLLALGNHPVVHQADLDYLGYTGFSGHPYKSGGAFPCLILPGRKKEFFYDTSFGREFAAFWELLWSEATDAVKRSDKIVLCGYSLPLVDQRARELLLQQPRKETHVSIVSGNQSERIAADYGAAGFGSVEVFKGGRFEDWVRAEVGNG